MSLLIDVIVRSSLVLVVGMAAVWVLRKQPAALRHWILAAAVALAAVQPLISQIIPALPLPTINWSAEVARGPSVETDISVEVTQPAPAPAAASSTISWPRLLLMLWAIGAAFSLAILLAGAIWLSWLGSKATDAGDRWLAEGELLRARMGSPRPVRILVTTHPALLVTWGTIAPVILLPADAPGWSTDRIRLVLAHELAHLARRDWMIQLAAEVARAINWFNPLFWLACGELRRESEYACDDTVLELGIGGTRTHHILSISRGRSACTDAPGCRRRPLHVRQRLKGEFAPC